jgi:hypothetical protein
MFILIILITILLAWKYGDWRNWQKYQSTMLLFSIGNFLYNFVYHDHFLWKFNPDSLNHHIMEIIYSFSVFPLTALIFLSNYPVRFIKQPLYIGKYILIYLGVELILYKMGMMEYDFGWNIWWSLAWNCVMFPILIIHYKKPLLGYVFCIFMIFGTNWLFPFKLD